MIPWVNMGDRPSWLKIAAAEKTFAKQTGGVVRYVGQLCVRTNGEWSESPVAVFWSEKLSDPSHKHYFGIYRQNGSTFICDATSVSQGVWFGSMHEVTGEVLFSRYRHDFRNSRDKKFFVDGGREYSRAGGYSIPTWINFHEGIPAVIDPKTLTEEERDALTEYNRNPAP